MPGNTNSAQRQHRQGAGNHPIKTINFLIYTVNDYYSNKLNRKHSGLPVLLMHKKHNFMLIGLGLCSG